LPRILSKYTYISAKNNCPAPYFLLNIIGSHQKTSLFDELISPHSTSLPYQTVSREALHIGAISRYPLFFSGMASDIRDKFGPDQIPTLNSARRADDRGTEKQRGRLRSTVEFSAARVMLALVGLLPRRRLLRICELLGVAGYALLPSLRRTGLRNLEMAFPDRSDLERREILRKSFQNLGRGLAVFSKFSKAGIEELRNSIDCVGIENLERAVAKG